jgi:hypothetical protein
MLNGASLIGGGLCAIYLGRLLGDRCIINHDLHLFKDITEVTVIKLTPSFAAVQYNDSFSLWLGRFIYVYDTVLLADFQTARKSISSSNLPILRIDTYNLTYGPIFGAKKEYINGLFQFLNQCEVVTTKVYKFGLYSNTLSLLDVYNLLFHYNILSYKPYESEFLLRQYHLNKKASLYKNIVRSQRLLQRAYFLPSIHNNLQIKKKSQKKKGILTFC